jgi:replication factor A1
MTIDLTPYGVKQMVSQDSSKPRAFFPILQVINIKDVTQQNGPGAPPRYRLVLSDGTHHIQGMLATQLSHIVHQSLHRFNIVRIKEYIANKIGEKNLIIVLDLDTVDAGPANKIGSPVDVESAPNHYTTSAPSVAEPMYNRTNVAGNPYSGNNPYTSPNAKANPYSPSRRPDSVGSGGGAIVHQGSDAFTPGGPKITPIAQLNMYQNRITIRARVTSKSDIRTWSNAKGEGSLFSVDLLDASGMDIRATMFKEAVDKFYNYFEVGRVYTISGGRLKVANQKYNTCKSGYELTLDQNSEIHLVEDTGDIQTQSFVFVKIGNLESVSENTNVDVKNY